jgi:hypothetical protein
MIDTTYVASVEFDEGPSGIDAWWAARTEGRCNFVGCAEQRRRTNRTQFGRPVLGYATPIFRHARRLLATVTNNSLCVAPYGVVAPSTGFLAFLVALQVCGNVSLYGFGPDKTAAGSRYSLTDHGGRFACNHDVAAEHRLMRAWATDADAFLARLDLPRALGGDAVFERIRRRAVADRWWIKRGRFNESQMRRELVGGWNEHEAAFYAHARCAKVRFVEQR